jgi:hypothetical protein
VKGMRRFSSKIWPRHDADFTYFKGDHIKERALDSVTFKTRTTFQEGIFCFIRGKIFTTVSIVQKCNTFPQ